MSGPWRRLVLAGLGLFETPYLADFAKQGAAGAIAEAGLVIRETARPLHSLFVVHVIRPSRTPAEASPAATP